MGQHGIEADWASAEMARLVATDWSHVFSAPPSSPTGLNTYATRDLQPNKWPIADGVVALEYHTSQRGYSLALEYKRAEEGIHGLLTAMGQALAYLDKGPYDAATIVVPATYPTHEQPGAFLVSTLERNAPRAPIGVATYHMPDPTHVSPFFGRLRIEKRVSIPEKRVDASGVVRRTQTQWAHLREGSTTRDNIRRFLEEAVIFANSKAPYEVTIPESIRLAAERMRPDLSAEQYLSSTRDDSPLAEIWRRTWFKWFVPGDALIPWRRIGSDYVPNVVESKLLRDDGRGSQLWFVGRSDSIKNVLAKQLNEEQLSEEESLAKFVENVANRAHSIREDLDSGLFHMRLIGPNAVPTAIGKLFLERVQADQSVASSGVRDLFAAILMSAGGLGSFLHYFSKLQESMQSAAHESPSEVLIRIEDAMANKLHVLRKVSTRGGIARKPFQAELALLRQYDLVARDDRGGFVEVNAARVTAIQELADRLEAGVV